MFKQFREGRKNIIFLTLVFNEKVSAVVEIFANLNRRAGKLHNPNLILKTLVSKESLNWKLFHENINLSNLGSINVIV